MMADYRAPTTPQRQHNGVVDRPLSQEEVLELLESCY